MIHKKSKEKKAKKVFSLELLKIKVDLNQAKIYVNIHFYSNKKL